MIRNLNQVSFRGYGMILPERAQTNKEMDKSSRKQLQLEENNAIVYRAASEVWLNCVTGMSVLSVSLDGEHYHHFYLDKPVCVKEGVLLQIY